MTAVAAAIERENEEVLEGNGTNMNGCDNEYKGLTGRNKDWLGMKDKGMEKKKRG